VPLTPGSFRSYLVLALVLFGLGLAAAWLIHATLALVGIASLWWLETPGALSVAITLFAAFDKWLWAWPPLRSIGLVQWPDLRGRWEGQLLTSFPLQEEPLPASIEIRQTATSIQVSLYARQSRSTSVFATIAPDEDGVPTLKYTYLNRPEALENGSMHMHLGSSELRYFTDIRELRGRYFTSHDRGNDGSMTFSFASKHLLGRFAR